MVRPGRKPSLATGRPPAWRRPISSLPSKATRSIIRRHHKLHKAHTQALNDGNQAVAAAVLKDIEEHGGIERYQKASITGQAADRGGDSSKILIEWLESTGIRPRAEDKYRMLEIGALATNNACSRSGLFDVTRIDLNPQDAKIQKQDFMERPLPSGAEEKFDAISLSLVLNYVPTPGGRGQMLRRTCGFLDRRGSGSRGSADSLFPLLFLVLPKACTANSRYFTEARLDEIMSSLGYRQRAQKHTKKLAYSLWTFDPTTKASGGRFAKVMLNDGHNRNNFHIILP